MPKKITRKPFLKAAKIVVSLVLCVAIFMKADWRELFDAVLASNRLYLAAAFSGMVGGVIISAFKWKLLLKIHAIPAGIRPLTRYYFSAVFFNNFLPSNIGGDTYRIYRTMQFGKSRAIVAVLTERITGLWALIVLGFFGAVWLHVFSDQPPPEWNIEVIFFLGVASAAPPLTASIFLSTSRLRSALTARSTKAALFFERIIDYRNNSAPSVCVLALSFLFQLYTLGWMLLLAYAVHDPTTPDKMIVGMVLSNMAALIPVSLNGIGLWDGSFIFIMSSLGMTYTGGLTVMLLIRCALIPLSLLGGIFYMKDHNEPGESIVSAVNNQLET